MSVDRSRVTLPNSSPTDTPPTSAYEPAGCDVVAAVPDIGGAAAWDPPGALTGPGGTAPPGYGAGGYWPAGYCPPCPAFRGCCGAVTGSPRGRSGTGRRAGHSAGQRCCPAPRQDDRGRRRTPRGRRWAGRADPRVRRGRAGLPGAAAPPATAAGGA